MYIPTLDHDPADDVDTLRRLLDDLAAEEAADAERDRARILDYLLLNNVDDALED